MHALPAAAELLAAARHDTGLAEPGDPRFFAALDMLIQSINGESSLTAEGAQAARQRFMRLLVNRLRFAADLCSSPQILAETLAPPLVICGLPRVGSTKLHRLLAEGGDFQSLLFWQGFNPAPFPGTPAGVPDPRIGAAESFLAWRSRLNPATDAAHHMAALEPEEDTYLLEYTLHTYWPTTYFNVPGFLRWLASQDRDHAFQYVRQLLQYLQWQFHRGSARPWLLKSPPNLGFEREMAHHLPGARFVVLHRDPIDVMPSTVAIVREVRRLYCGSAGDLKLVGDWALDEYPRAMRRHMEWRRTAAREGFLDIAYADVVADERGVIERIYAHCGMHLSVAALARMQQWSAGNTQHRYGEHVYSLEESGMTRQRVEAAFADYIGHFAHFIRG